MRTVSIKLPESLDDAVTELAARQQTNRSAVVREALLAYTAQRQRSVTELVDEVTGGFAGPADLSTNPRHMAGYGK
jgi:predicted transcriptional regulator